MARENRLAKNLRRTFLQVELVVSEPLPATAEAAQGETDRQTWTGRQAPNGASAWLDIRQAVRQIIRPEA